MKLSKKIDVGEAVRFLEEGGSVSQAFRESLEAGGILARDLQHVAAAVNGMLNSGLTREALVLLISAKCKGKTAGGRPLPLQTIDDVLEAMAHLDQWLTKPATKAGE